MFLLFKKAADPVALAYIEDATSHLVAPDLATLQGILDDICDGGGRGSTDGRACPRRGDRSGR